jgi:2-oxoglutarate ferredoxin oxidoreductase subunit beta
MLDRIAQFNGYDPTWCPGCGDWGIGIAVKTALAEQNLTPSDIFVSFDIGCSGNMNDFLNAYAVHGLHGRAVTYAIGMKLANHAMQCMVVGGDGGLYGEGGNHFLHACRGNHDITMVVHDNNVYGLTTGQVAPTAEQGYKSKSTPAGIIELPVNPLALAISQGATFVAQSFAGNVKHVTQMIQQGMKHKGLSIINILQPCVTFNKIDTYQYYLQRTYHLEEDYDKTQMDTALQKAHEVIEEKFPLGIIYQSSRPAFHEMIPQLSEKPLVSRDRTNVYRDFLNEFV